MSIARIVQIKTIILDFSRKHWIGIDVSSEVAQALAETIDAELGDATVVEAVRAATTVADSEDVTDWQRGYRACAQFVRGALDGVMLR